MENMVNFWKGKRVFVTGHTGFKGSWLVLWLRHLGAEVAGYALSPVEPNALFHYAKVAEGILDHRADITNYPTLLDAISQFQPEIIFHLAAQSLVRHSFEFPIETYATNVMGTVNLLEAARHVDSVRAVVNVTTDKCYENHEWPWGYRESDVMGGYDPYSSSKGCVELLTAAWQRSWYLSQNSISARPPVGLATARAGNVIGGGDWAKDRLIPDLMMACIKNRKISIRYPAAIRPWQHVLEPLSGYLQLAENLYRDPISFSEPWNFGPRDVDVRSVSSVADQVLSVWGSSVGWEHDVSPVPHEAGILKLDCSKAFDRLGWQPKWDINAAIDATVHWYKSWHAGEEMRQVTLDQIKNYMWLVK